MRALALVAALCLAACDDPGPSVNAGNVSQGIVVNHPDTSVKVDPKCLPPPLNEWVRVKRIVGRQVTVINDTTGQEWTLDQDCILQ